MTMNFTKVKAVGFDIAEEVAASIMLAGLPAEYKPLIFGLENSSTRLTTDYVNGILLQGVIMDFKSDQASALFAKKKKFKKVKCFNCGGPHFADKCKKSKKNSDKKGKQQTALFT